MERLSTEQKNTLFTQIRALDPKGEIVSLTPGPDFRGGSISYSKESGIILGELAFRLNDEEYVRAWLLVRLIKKLGYPADRVELEHTYTIGRPSPTKAQIDIRIHARDSVIGKKERVFMLIEVKRPDEFTSYEKLLDDQLFATGRDEVSRGLRYVVWHTVEFRGDEPRDCCIIIDFKEYTEHRAWVEAGEPGHNLDLPREYGIVRKTKFVKAGEHDLRTDLTRADFTRLQRDFHNRLWGGAKMGDTDVFKNLLKMFIAKIHDENGTDVGKAYRFQTELKDGRPETAEETLTKVNKLYREAMAHYFGYDEEALSHERINREQFSANKVAYVMEKLEGISITENKFEDDVLGTFFEAIVRTGFKQEKGQFFTHTNIVRFVLHALGLDLDIIDRINSNSPTIPHIIDPACGSGTFIIEAMKLITQSVLHPHPGAPTIAKSRRAEDFVEEWFSPLSKHHNIQNRWARQFVYGIEPNADLALATKVNMIVHGDGNANIFKNDGLAAFAKYEPTKGNLNTRLQLEDGEGKRTNQPYKLSCNEQFDVVVSNPPFSLKDDPRTVAEYAGRFLYGDRKSSENLFIERWYQLLRPGGRLGVVLPDSVFDTNENLYIRLFLYRFFFIKAVVSLPQVSFQPYTPTKTSLLFAVKKKKTEVEAWDAAWRNAAREYKKIRDTEVVSLLRTNDRLRNGLIDLANKAEVEWYPSTNLLAATTLPPDMRQALMDACEDSATLKKKLTRLFREFDAFVGENKLSAISGADEKAARVTLLRLLRDRLPADATKLGLAALLEAAYDDVVAAAELNHAEGPKGEPYCNAWWCFAEVTSRKEFDYPIFFAEAEHVGYKRTKRHPEGIDRPNDLFATDDSGNIAIDTDKPRTILDRLRSREFFFSEARRLTQQEHHSGFHQKLSRFALSFSLRNSARFNRPMFDLLESMLRGISTTTLRKICAAPITSGVAPEYSDEGDGYYLSLKQLSPNRLDLSEAKRVDSEFADSCHIGAHVQSGDVLIALAGEGTIGKVGVYTASNPAILSNFVGRIRVKEAHSPSVVAYVLRGQLFQSQVEREKAGMGNLTNLYPSQVGGFRVPVLSASIQKRLSSRIGEIEEEIGKAEGTLRTQEDIINEILCAEFRYALKEHREREREKYFTAGFHAMMAGFTLRSSANFHHPSFELTEHFFARTPHERVKAYVSIPIRLGATATKADFVEEGAAYYVHPGATKRQEVIATEDCHQVTEEFYAATHRRFGLRAGDVVINRSGEALGKVALWDSEEPAVASDFTMRIRFNSERMNPRFAWYFFRSVMFQAQIQRELRGSSVSNIFPPEVQQMVVVSSKKTKQDALARDITTELQRRTDALMSIESKRADISALIDKAVRP